MTIVREQDEIFNELITNHFNKSGKNPSALLLVFYSAVASIAWGVYAVAAYVSNQILPSSADAEWVEKHAKSRGIIKDANETTDELLDRVNDDVQYPRAGGNVFDWPRWAKEVSYTHDAGLSTEWVETVKDAVLVENARGGGTINIVITSDSQVNGQEEWATNNLVAAVTAYLETVRVVGVWDVLVVAASPLGVNVTINVTASDFPAISGTIETQIENLLKSKLPGEILPQSQISSIATESGAIDVVVALPAATVAPNNGPTEYQRVWPGTITVNEV